MLNELIITNFVIVDSVTIEFSAGLNIVTGETGAGKSILLDALGLCIGMKADSSLVKHGKKQAEISATFNLSANHDACQWLQANDFIAEDENDTDEVIIRRIIKAQGNSKAYINGQACTVQQLRQFGEFVIFIHSQHQHQQLTKASYQKELLDHSAQLLPLVSHVSDAYYAWQAVYKNWQEQCANQSTNQQRQEFLRFQLDELDELAPQEDEVSELEDQQKSLSNAESIIHNYTHCLERLADSEYNAQDLILQAQQALNDNIKYNKALTDINDTLESALINIQEACTDINVFLSQQTLEPEALTAIEERLSLYYSVARKHGVEAENLHQTFVELQAELNELDDPQLSLTHLANHAEQLKTEYMSIAEQLSKKRQESAVLLASEINTHIHALGMTDSQLKISLIPQKEPQPSGLESVQFDFSANKGQPLSPLSKVASGGELSRISLSIQTVAAAKTHIPSVFFDEVDVGIGGAVADMIGEKLQQLAQHTQIFCITHLAQVAAYGDSHWKVEKYTQEDQTLSRISALDTEARVHELARMQGGQTINETAIAHARSLLNHAHGA